MPPAHRPTGSSARVRRVALGVAILVVVAGAAALSWCCLPRWTPRLVIRHSPWLGPLLRAAAACPDADAQDEVAVRLAAWGAGAVPGLTVALASGEAPLRVVAATGLGRLRDRAAVGPLLHALDDPDDATVMAAADALGRIGDPAAADGLLALLRSDEDLVRDCALRNLAGLALSDAQRRSVEAYQRSIR